MSEDPSNVISLPKIDEQLSDGVVALRQLAACYNLLDKGLFPHTHLAAVTNALAYLKLLHQQMSMKVLAHPDADKIPELQQLKESHEKEAEKIAALQKELAEASKVSKIGEPDEPEAAKP